MTIYSAVYVSPLGGITIASDGSSIVGLWFEGQKYFAAPLVDDPIPDSGRSELTAVKQWLDQYFAGNNPSTDGIALNPQGSPYRQQVWQALREVPYGQTSTYGQIGTAVAHRAGKIATSSRAVGGAVGHNPISVIIPCHRIVSTSGSLTGYAGGLGRKIALLELEGVDMTHLWRPTAGTAL